MTAPAAVGLAEVRFDEVYLSGSTVQGPALVGGLALFANEQGITVLGPEPSSVRTMSWKRASTVAFRNETVLPDGRGAVTLEIEIDGSPLRFFVPSAGLGPSGARTLEEQIASLARVPTALTPPKPMGEPATASPPAVAGIPGLVMPGAAGTQSGSVPTMTSGTLPSGAVLAPATGGTLSAFQGGLGTALQVSKKRKAPKRMVMAALVILVAGGGTAAYVIHERGTTGTGSSADAVSATAVNLSPGDLPGWKGISGTTAGALGALGYRKLSSAKPTSFAACTKSSIADADAALSVLGFSEALPGAADSTAESSSPLFEDPTAAGTRAVSSSIVLDSAADEQGVLSVFAGSGFSACYSRYLDTVVPALIGGTTAGDSIRGASIVPIRIGATENGDAAYGFTETIQKGGRHPGTALSGNFVVVARGRMIAVLSTASPRQFPVTDGLKLLTTVEQNLAEESR